MEFVKKTQALLSEVRYTGNMYTDTFSFNDPGQIGAEEAWEDFGRLFEEKPGEGEEMNSLRRLFHKQIDSLLMPCLRNRPDAIPPHEKMKLLRMRRCVFMDVRDSIQSLLDIHSMLAQSARGDRFKIGIMGNMIHEDVEQLLPIERQIHGEKAWDKPDFHQLVKKRSVGLKAARGNRLIPLGLPHLRVATTHDGHHLGYIMGEFETADVRYETIHGMMTGNRYRMILQTAGIRREASPAIIDEMTYDLLETALKERPHRLENRLGSYHS